MSFTLMYYKNGALVPIRLSIWDAFKGAPRSDSKLKSKPVSDIQPIATQEPVPVHYEATTSTVPLAADGTAITPVVVTEPPPPELYMSIIPIEPVSTAVECPCCQKIHCPGQAPDNAKEQENKKAEDKTKKGGKDEPKTGGKDDKEGNPFSTKDQETYSEEDNVKITEMKGQGKSWQEILDAIGKKSKSQLQAHWKKMNSNDTEDKEKTGDKKPEEKKTDDKSKKDNDEKKKAESQAKKDTPGGKGAVKKDTKKDEKAEVGELRSWSDRYDRQKWIAAASRHFDLTGQRITPDVAKRLAEGK